MSGRELPKEALVFKQPGTSREVRVVANDKGDWTHHLKRESSYLEISISKYPLLSYISLTTCKCRSDSSGVPKSLALNANLEKWAIVVTQRDSLNVDELLRVLTKIGAELGTRVSPPTQV